MPDPGDGSQPLVAVRASEKAALDRLLGQAYDELHALAHRQLASQRSATTLSTTALVHETYLKLADSRSLELTDRSHLLALAARAMRQVIIDHARRARAKKRGGEQVRVTLHPSAGSDPSMGDADVADLVTLDDALTALEQASERLARIVELRYFGGLSVEETGEVLDLSPRTVKRDWRKARAFLFHALGGAA